jgi:CRISPR-associated endonuclease/helicase Cas3
MPTTYYAHTLSGRPESDWELLETHLANVARRAADFAGAFGAADWGRLAGLWHDLGKASDEFQKYLRKSENPDAAEYEDAPGRVDHSTAGAQHAFKVIGKYAGQLLAYCIAGHHAGLPDGSSGEEATRGSTLQARLKKVVPVVTAPVAGPTAPALKVPFRAADRANLGFQLAFFARMLFSALIDADRTATEEFCNPGIAAERARPKPSIVELQTALDAFLDGISAAPDYKPTDVNRLRAQVLADCRTEASSAPSFFSLNVPTGGGKTYASLAFALRHARSHELRRVVVAVPFTTIIEQTADAYRKALGSLADRGLVEHHSNLDPRKDTRNNKLAVENWDAPLIVTTNVQLFESLFAAHTTPCRKLHRLARSVIILDEAQTIPVDLLWPTLAALKELVAHYGCTVVLCTATQPALERREHEFEIGIEKVQPIARDAQALFAALRRVQVTRLGLQTDEQVVERLSDEPAVLCVVNTRPHAAALYDALVAKAGKEGCYHLSTFMCAQHRRERLAEIRGRLKEGRSCRLISTQLIEAGVDVDFPVVYRAPAGFDSIAQAAGRCNREGRLEKDGLPTLGRVYVFDTEKQPPIGLLRDAAQCGRELFERHPDPLIPAAVEDYFRLLYWQKKTAWDKHDVMGALADDLTRAELILQFREAAKRYQIIRDEQVSILVPYDAEARRIRDELRKNAEVNFQLMRDAQRYIVGVHEHLLCKLESNGVVVEHPSAGLWLLVNEGAYSAEKGLTPDAVGIDAALLIQ